MNYWMIPAFITLLAILYFFLHDNGKDELGVGAFFDAVIAIITITLAWGGYFFASILHIK
jgi:hypothetical protein